MKKKFKMLMAYLRGFKKESINFELSISSQDVEEIEIYDGVDMTSTFYSYFESIVNQYADELYDEGHHITFFTSRGMTGTNGNVLLCYERYFEFTKKQLNDWGVKYHQLILGKPPAEFYIDDHASNDIDFFEENNEHHNSNYDV